MLIKEFKKYDLELALKENSLWQGENYPITKHRLISHITNPRLSEEDTLLTVSYDENNNINGYIGTLPDYIFTKSGKKKMAWFSTWWVNTNDKNSNLIGSLLFESAMKSYENNIGVSGFAASVERVYKASRKFISLKKLDGKIIYLKSPIRNIILEKYGKLSSFYFLFKIVDILINSFISIKTKSINIPEKFSLEYINEIDNDTQEFINGFHENNLTKRSKEELDWIIKYPWIIEGNIKDDKYYFSSTAKSVENIGLKIKDENNSIIAFLILRKKNNQLRITYTYFNKKYSDLVLKIISKESIKKGIEIVYLYNESLLSQLNKSNLPHIFSKSIIRKSIISKNFKNEISENLDLQEGDGDCAFT